MLCVYTWQVCAFWRQLSVTMGTEMDRSVFEMKVPGDDELSRKKQRTDSDVDIMRKTFMEMMAQQQAQFAKILQEQQSMMLTFLENI